MMATSNDVANQAIQLAGNNIPPVTGFAPTFDTSTVGTTLAYLYPTVVATVGRQFGWDFARNLVTLTATGNTPFLYAYEYVYPTNGVEVWQIIPATIDVNNPLPTTWSVANALVNSVQTKVIQTDVAAAQALYNNNPTEATWDSLFRESVVRLLASELAMANFGRPDTAESYLQSGAAFENLGEMRKG